MTPLWMAFRGELSEYSAVAQIRRSSRCGVSGVERKARRYLDGVGGPTTLEVCEHSHALCIARISHVFAPMAGVITRGMGGLYRCLPFMG